MNKLIHGFLCEIELDEDTLAHYGVKGMKWRYRKGKTVAPGSAYATLYKRNDIEALVDAAKLVGKKGKSSTSTKAKKEKAAKDKKGSSKEKKEKESKVKEGETLKDRIDAIKAKRVDTTYYNDNRSQLPIARRKAAELEARKKRLKERRLS